MPTHDRAAVISVGDELILGQTLDTNSRWISATLASWNIRVVEHVTVPDDLDAQVDALRRLGVRVPLVIVTGGLGPTLDDLTRQALADVMGEELVTDEPALRALEALFRSRGRDLSAIQRTQAQRPRSASMLANPHGTAPGLHARLAASQCDAFCLPGPPGEMQPMLLEVVRPMLRVPEGLAVVTRVMHTLGLGEGDLAQRLGALMARDRNPLVGTTASGGVVSIRVRYEGPDAVLGAREVEATARACADAAGPFLFGEGDESIASAALASLRAASATLVTAESCTGGLIGAMLTAVPGSSDAYLGGWVTYANELKASALRVPARVLEAHGAVSAECCRAMLDGALDPASGASADWALAVTGVAGPSGGSDDKPVGTVFIGAASRAGHADVRRFRFPGARDVVRDRAAKMALAMLRFGVNRLGVPRLLWQVA